MTRGTPIIRAYPDGPRTPEQIVKDAKDEERRVERELGLNDDMVMAMGIALKGAK